MSSTLSGAVRSRLDMRHTADSGRTATMRSETGASTDEHFHLPRRLRWICTQYFLRPRKGLTTALRQKELPVNVSNQGQPLEGIS